MNDICYFRRQISKRIDHQPALAGIGICKPLMSQDQALTVIVNEMMFFTTDEVAYREFYINRDRE